MKSSQTFRFLIAALAAVLLTVACGSSESAPVGADDDSESTTDAPVAAATEVPAEAAPTEVPAAAPADAAEAAPAETSDTSDSSDDDSHTHDDETTHTHDSDELELDLFVEGALVETPTTGECTLTDGSTTECYTITVVGTPVGQDVGPFCPTNVADSEEAGGLWLDGENSYVIDGEFFTELASIYGDDLWNNIVNDDGSINVIDNAEEFQVAARPDITEEFYYHCVDGDVAWLTAGAQPTTTIQVPVTPALSDAATVQFATGAHSTLGVTLNGAALSGSADMTAILASYTIAAFDDCGGHINPALGYHVHGTAGCSDVGESSTTETAPFALAIDGYTIHAPHDEADGIELDECNGHTTDEYGYHYHANPLEENATLTCLMGLTVEGQNAGGRPGGAEPGGGGERPERPEGGGPPPGE